MNRWRIKKMAAIGSVAAAILLLSCAVSLAAVKLIVVRNTATNALTATVCDSANSPMCVVVQNNSTAAFTSSALPTLDWDETLNSSNGGWMIIGLTSNTDGTITPWTGQIVYNGAGASRSANLQAVSGNPAQVILPTKTFGEETFEQVVSVKPSPAVCTSSNVTTWGSCQMNNTQTASAYSSACTPPATPLTMPCTYTQPVCTSTDVTVWTPGTCPSTGTQTAGSYASTCTAPATPLIRNCNYVPPACTAADVTLWTPTTCPTSGVQTSSTYASTCTAPATAFTRTCTPGLSPCTSSSQVTAWTPTTCPSSGIQTATAYVSTCSAPATALTQSCTYSGGDPTDPPGTVSLPTQSLYTDYTLAAGSTKYYKFTGPAGGCSPRGWLQVHLVAMNATGGDGQLIVKTSNKQTAPWPTVDDYTAEFAKTGYLGGQDWTRDAAHGGYFFWNFVNGNTGETVTVLKSYITGQTVDQSDTFYVLLYNAGTLPNTYHVYWQCL